MLLEIRNLFAEIEGNKVLKGLNLSVNSGEVHAIMGPNEAGKTTLANAIMGNPKYTITNGDILFDGKSILKMAVDERAKIGYSNHFNIQKRYLVSD